MYSFVLYLKLTMFVFNNIHKVLQSISFFLFLLSTFNFLFGNDNISLDNISDVNTTIQNNTSEIREDINFKSEQSNNNIVPPLNIGSRIKRKCY